MDYQLFEIDDQVDVDVDVTIDDDPEPEPIITRSTVREQRQAEIEGVRIKLPVTRGTAIVKEMDIEDVIAGGWLPQNLKRVLGELIGGGTSGPRKVKDGIEAFHNLQGLASNELKLADALVINGFINPQVVAKESELDPDRDDQMLITDLHARDRRAYMRLVMRDRSDEEADVLEPFRS